MQIINIFTDGGARGNPGPAAIGVYITNGENYVLHKISQAIGSTTNNVAEYSAVVAALSWLIEQKDSLAKDTKIHFFMDSLLVASQISGLYKVKNARLADLLFLIRQKEGELQLPITYSHIPREKNKHADSLVNQALDNTG